MALEEKADVPKILLALGVVFWKKEKAAGGGLEG